MIPITNFSSHSLFSDSFGDKWLSGIALVAFFGVSVCVFIISCISIETRQFVQLYRPYRVCFCLYKYLSSNFSLKFSSATQFICVQEIFLLCYFSFESCRVKKAIVKKIRLKTRNNLNITKHLFRRCDSEPTSLPVPKREQPTAVDSEKWTSEETT